MSRSTRDSTERQAQELGSLIFPPFSERYLGREVMEGLALLYEVLKPYEALWEPDRPREDWLAYLKAEGILKDLRILPDLAGKLDRQLQAEMARIIERSGALKAVKFSQDMMRIFKDIKPKEGAEKIQLFNIFLNEFLMILDFKECIQFLETFRNSPHFKDPFAAEMGFLNFYVRGAERMQKLVEVFSPEEERDKANFFSLVFFLRHFAPKWQPDFLPGTPEDRQEEAKKLFKRLRYTELEPTKEPLFFIVPRENPLFGIALRVCKDASSSNTHPFNIVDITLMPPKGEKLPGGGEVPGGTISLSAIYPSLVAFGTCYTSLGPLFELYKARGFYQDLLWMVLKRLELALRKGEIKERDWLGELEQEIAEEESLAAIQAETAEAVREAMPPQGAPSSPLSPPSQPRERRLQGKFANLRPEDIIQAFARLGVIYDSPYRDSHGHLRKDGKIFPLPRHGKGKGFNPVRTVSQACRTFDISRAEFLAALYGENGK